MWVLTSNLGCSANSVGVYTTVDLNWFIDRALLHARRGNSSALPGDNELCVGSAGVPGTQMPDLAVTMAHRRECLEINESGEDEYFRPETVGGLAGSVWRRRAALRWSWQSFNRYCLDSREPFGLITPNLCSTAVIILIGKTV
ncbi:hypothetical protein J6590_038820 [Homalodisca vitripennis]|nr:hypothetical protein J6590_038820 [Homalodisca vitripennis]